MLGLGGFGATIEVVRAQVLIAGAVLEHVIDGCEDGSGAGADGLFGINGLSLAITSGIGLRGLARVIHTYPTQAEAIKMAADAYNRTRLTPTLKSLTRRWLAW